ncbi:MULTISPECIES: phage holin family protein [Myxococcaceae]|uniref:phage holin family protein n=1 Tax=Myxococcaceae TaxID=31 RepID=UPI001E3A0CF9|nr:MULTISPECIES: phage holin family protein [Myxococcaceae]
MGTEIPDRGITALISRMADGFSRLVTQHIALARLELAEDARQMGAGLGRIAAFLPFVLTGYALLCGALSLVLARWVGLAGGLALVGAANVVGGGLGLARALQGLRSVKVMHGTQEELNRSAAALAAPPRAPTEGPDGR